MELPLRLLLYFWVQLRRRFAIQSLDDCVFTRQLDRSVNTCFITAAIYIGLVQLEGDTLPGQQWPIAYKSIHEPMVVPDGFTLEFIEGNPAYIALEETSDYTTVLIPLTTEQAKFMTTVAAKEAHRVDKLPGYMRAPTLGFIGMFYSVMDAVGYMSWLIHSGHDSTEDMSYCYIYRVSLHTAEILQRVYEKKISIFNRGYIGLCYSNMNTTPGS